MAESLSPLQYGTVVGRFLVELGDSNDTDLKPDVHPARGTLLFTPAVSYANVKSAQPDPTTIFPQPVIGVLDSLGYLYSVEVDNTGLPVRTINGDYIPSQKGLRIQASSDPNISPSNWTWRVSFNLNFSGISLKYDPFEFTLDPNQVVDLAYVKPTAHSSGTITITGPRGEQGDQGPKGETGPVNTLKIGTVTTTATGTSASATITGNAPNQTLNLSMPQGPVGPAGGPIPPGGTANQQIRKNSSGGYEWFTPSHNSPIRIPESADLDTYTAPDDYHQPVNVDAASGTNYPSPYAGMLYVRAYPSNFIYQYYHVYAGAGGDGGKIYTRAKYGASAWNPWKDLTGADIAVATSTTDGLLSKTDKVKIDGATSASTANTLVSRDSSGRSYFTRAYSSSDPTATTELTNKKYVDGKVASASTKADLISNMRSPLVISHRGGPRIYPEHSMEGYIASSESGYVPEMDIQFLSDGTPVCCHDATVTRTMTGVTGNVSSLTPEQWRTARIKPVYEGGKTAKPVFFSDVLDRLGGQILLMPEIKTGATTAQVGSVITMVKDRGLDKAVILQSFDFEACKQIKAAGLEPLFLTGTTSSVTSATLVSEGIKYAGPSKSMSASLMQSLFFNNGIKVFPYTVNTLKEVSALPSAVSGYFSDDPWYTSGELQASSVAEWTQGNGWPARRNTIAISGTPETVTDSSNLISVGGGGVHIPYTADRGLIHVGVEHISGGLIKPPFTFSARLVFGRQAGSQTTNAGFTLYRNTIDPEADFRDAAIPGQEGMTFAVRRSGTIQAWEFVGGAAASSIVKLDNASLVIPENRTGSVNVKLEVGPTWFGIFIAETGSYVTGSHSFNVPLIPLLRSSPTEVTFHDVHIKQETVPFTAPAS